MDFDISEAVHSVTKLSYQINDSISKLKITQNKSENKKFWMANSRQKSKLTDRMT